MIYFDFKAAGRIKMRYIHLLIFIILELIFFNKNYDVDSFVSRATHHRCISSSTAVHTMKKKICLAQALSSSEAVMIGDNMFRSYEYVAENYSLATDIATSGLINTISDSLAQVREERDNDSDVAYDISDESTSFNSIRTIRLTVFGLLDGAVSHVWFVGLDEVVGDGKGLTETVLKTAADAMVYTPIWCAWFLAVMAVLESPNLSLVGTRFRSIPVIWRSNWAELLSGNLSFFLPLTGLIYGFVSVEFRVLVFGLASLVYTTILSIWNESRVVK